MPVSTLMLVPSALAVLNAVSAASVQTEIALPVKDAVMAVHPGVVRTWLKASAPTA